LLRGRGDAALISALMDSAAAKEHVSTIASVLLVMKPSRRAVDRLAYWAHSSEPDMAALALRVLAQAPPGEYQRVIAIAERALANPSKKVRSEANRCMSEMKERRF